MARINRKTRTAVRTMWVDPITGITFTADRPASLTAGEMREVSRWALALQNDLRDGTRPLVTTLKSDAPSVLQAAAILLQGRKHISASVL